MTTLSGDNRRDRLRNHANVDTWFLHFCRSQLPHRDTSYRRARGSRPGIQCRVIEARRKTTAGLMALLTHIRGRRVCGAFADGSDRMPRR